MPGRHRSPIARQQPAAPYILLQHGVRTLRTLTHTGTRRIKIRHCRRIPNRSVRCPVGADRAPRWRSVPAVIALWRVCPARRGQPAADRGRAAALGPAAPDHPRRPALPAGLRPGARRRCRAPLGQKPHPPSSVTDPRRAGSGPPRRHRPLQPPDRGRALHQRQDRQVPPGAHLRQARHPIPHRPHRSIGATQTRPDRNQGHT